MLKVQLLYSQISLISIDRVQDAIDDTCDELIFISFAYGM